MPSGPGWFCPRVMGMKLVGGSSAVFGAPSGPGSNKGSSGRSGMMTVPPPLVTRSRPWSKNWPKNVNIRLYGADSPKSGVMFGMNSAPDIGSGSVGPEHTNPPDPHGLAAAAAAAGLFADWSTTRLVIRRGWLSLTNPFFCVYDVGSPAACGPGPSGSNGSVSAER